MRVTSFLLACCLSLRSTHAGRGVGANEAVGSTEVHRDGPDVVDSTELYQGGTNMNSELADSELQKSQSSRRRASRATMNFYRKCRRWLKKAGHSHKMHHAYYCMQTFRQVCEWRSPKAPVTPGVRRWCDGPYGYIMCVREPKLTSGYGPRGGKGDTNVQKVQGCQRYFRGTMRRRTAHGDPYRQIASGRSWNMYKTRTDACRAYFSMSMYYQNSHNQVFTRFSTVGGSGSYGPRRPVYGTNIKTINLKNADIHGRSGRRYCVRGNCLGPFRSRWHDFQLQGYGYLNIAQAGKYKVCLTSNTANSRLRGMGWKRGFLLNKKTKNLGTVCRSLQLRRGSHFMNVEAFNGKNRHFQFALKYKGRDTANRLVLVGSKGTFRNPSVRQCKKPVYKPYKNTKRTQKVCGSSVVRPRCHGAGCHYRKSYNHGGCR